MLPQSEHDRQKAALMEATVKAVAEDGMENLSTREISRRCGLKEVYIYRYFENKDDMVAKTFAESDERFLKLVLNNLPVMKNEAIEYEARCRYLFTKCWEYMMANSERVIFYIQYYYSAAFQRYSYYDHMERFDVLIEKMRPVCPPDANVNTVLHHLFDTLLGQAKKQILHPKDEKHAENDTFYLLFSVIKGGKQN